MFLTWLLNKNLPEFFQLFASWSSDFSWYCLVFFLSSWVFHDSACLQHFVTHLVHVLYLDHSTISWLQWAYYGSSGATVQQHDYRLWFFLAHGLTDLAVLLFNHEHFWLFSLTTTSKFYFLISSIFGCYSTIYPSHDHNELISVNFSEATV